jgi:hypothetical protein
LQPIQIKEMPIAILISLPLYIILNLIVSKKINQAYYLKEERRSLHKKVIWIIPFLGPLLIKSHWSKNEEKLKVTTEANRRNKRGNNTDNWESLTGYGGGGGFE